MNWGHCLPSCLLLSLASVGIAAVILSILAKTGHRIPAPRYCLPTANSHAKQWVQVWGGAHRSPRLRISLYPNCCTFSARHPVLLPPFGLYSFLQDSHASSTSRIRQSSYWPTFHQALVEILGEWDIRRTLCGLARTLKPVCWRRPKRRPGGPRNKEGGAGRTAAAPHISDVVQATVSLPAKRKKVHVIFLQHMSFFQTSWMSPLMPLVVVMKNTSLLIYRWDLARGDNTRGLYMIAENGTSNHHN